MSVSQARRDVGDSRTLVERDDFDATDPIAFQRVHEEAAAPRMLQDIGSHFRDCEADLARNLAVESETLGALDGGATRVAYLAALVEKKEGRREHDAGLGDVLEWRIQRQRVIATRVPLPGVESMENSFDRRFAPLNPRPSPAPVVYPSFSARLI